MKRHAILLIVLFIVASTLPLTPQAAGAPKKTDLVVSESTAAKTGTLADADQVCITITVRNIAAPPDCSGLFSVAIDWQPAAASGESVAWISLGEAELPGLCVERGNRQSGSAKIVFSDAVPSGLTRRYRITVDSAQQVEESNEENNVRITEYTASGTPPPAAPPASEPAAAPPPCQGVDIDLLSIEIARADDGKVSLRATVRNLCQGSCSGNIVLSVDESAVSGRTGVVEQVIGNGIEGLQTIAMSGMLGVFSRPDADLAYSVSVRLEGECVDTQPANNVCRVTLLAGEKAKTVECR